MAYTKYSLTPGNNTAAPPDGAPEGMLPSAVNDTMRDMMAQIRDCGDGIRGGTYTMTAPVITGGSVTGVTAVSTSGNLTFTGTGNRILGDFTNGTTANRVLFQTSTTNSITVVGAVSNGSGAGSLFQALGSADTANSPHFSLVCDTTLSYLESSKNGTGSFQPMAFRTNGAERLRIDTSGNVGIGATPNSGTYNRELTLSSGAGQFCGFTIQNTTTGTSGGLAASINNTLALLYNRSNDGLLFGTNNTERMRIDSSGNVSINRTAGIGGARFTVKANTTGTGSWVTFTANTVDSVLFGVLDNGGISTGSFTSSPYNLTTGSAANMFVASDGILYRSTSSLKYKEDVQDATHGLSEVLKLRPVTYKGKNDGDKVFGGLIAEEVHEAGLSEFVVYRDDDGTPDALNYGNMVSLAFKAIQELKATVDAQAARIAALESK
jgi:hypothetical protein